MRPRLLLAAVSAAALLAACGRDSSSACNDSGGASMCPGDDCLSCHGFKAAGTVYAGTAPVGSATVTLVDRNGVAVTKSTNSAGNFYTTSALTYPLQRVTIDKGADTVEMLDVASGHCNDCHDARFRIHLP